ncbi:MAG TPA: PP2C family protein-serine/threonine phosphatase, partial [Solirubrobacteraceae bacterium]
AAATSAPFASTATTAVLATPKSSASPATAGSAPATRARRSHGKRPSSTVAGATNVTAGAIAGAAVVASTPPGAGLRSALRAKSHSRHGARHATGHEASSPLTKTLTKIVGVVPTPVRILIGALLALALALGVRSRLIARRARRLERQRGELLEDVGLLQAALLPVVPARLGPVGTTAAYRPAAGPGAGGDFYDIFALEDGQLAVIVGDVSGHGRKALPHTALVRFTLRAYLEAGLSPRGAVQTAGAVLEHQLGDSFATVIAATYNPRTRRLVYAAAGHPPPVVLGTGPQQESLEALTVCSAPPLGVGMASGTRQTIVAVPGGAQVCFYTDGVTEARVGTELFGPSRLAHTLAAVGADGNAAELLDRVSAQVDRRPDDMAACLLSIAGSAEAPHGIVEEVELDRETVAGERAHQLLLACGVGAAEARAVLRSAQQMVASTGSVVLEVHRADSRARVSFQNDNLTYLQTRHAARQADRMVTL